MRRNYLKGTLKTVSVGILILLCITAASAQVTVNLTATRQTALMPDGTTVPVWGWQCTNNVLNGATATTAVPGGGTCSTLNGTVQTGGAVWQPPLITVPTGSGLTINLTNGLPVNTSLVIVGQLNGGGLGTPVREAGPRTDGAHGTQTTTTWTQQLGACPTPGPTCTAPAPFTPPAQGQRVRSFVPEARPNSGTQTYAWGGAGQAPLRPGTYLIETGTYPSIQAPMGLYGVLVVTTAPVAGTSPTPGTAYSGSVLMAAPNTTKPYSIRYDADVPLMLSEIDPVQNGSVERVLESQAGCPTNTGACTSAVPAVVETAKWNPTCAASATVGQGCYPPAVDYKPTYFLINGTAFDKTSTASSALAVPAAAPTGNVLVRFVNAGSRMHVPSLQGLSMSLIAEDANVVQDVALQAAKGGSSSFVYNTKTQSEVFLPAGKVYDVIANPAASSSSYTPGQFLAFDRQLSLSGNGFRHDTGMQAIVLVNSSTGMVTPLVQKSVIADNFIVPVGTSTFTGNVLSNDVGISNAAQAGTCSGSFSSAPQTFTTAGGRTVVLNPNGSFTLTVGTALTAPDTFQYCGDGLSAFTTTVTLNAATLGGSPTANPDTYTSNVSGLLKVNAPGVLANDLDPTGYPLTSVIGTVQSGLVVTLSSDGGFTATPQTAPTSGTATYTFTYTAKNSQGSTSAPTTVTLTFHAGSGLQVTVQDAQTPSTKVADYKWIIEQDLTFQVNPACQQNGSGGSKPANCPTGPVPTLGTNLHTSYMPVIAVGCTGPQSCERGQTVYDPTTGQHLTAACDGYGNCTTGQTSLPATLPSEAYLPPTDQFGRPAYYYISVLPGDAANAFNTGNASDPSVSGNCTVKQTPTGQNVPSCGHTMGGAPIAPGQTAVTVNVEPNPLSTATITAFVFEDDFPLNGEPDTGGGVDTYPTQEAGLDDFQIELWDIAGSVSADPTGQMTYDMFNQPLTNALNGTIDPLTGLNACPISNTGGVAMGTIIVCPKFESDGVTQSPLTGQVVVKNLMPGLFDVVAHPGAAREARGEEWLQTNTLDGTHFQEAFIKVHEPAYFQEYGPGGYHVFFGEANPAIINRRLAAICGSAGAPACRNTVQVQVANLHQGRSPDERLFTSDVFPKGDGRNYAALNYTNCYGALGDTDGVTFSFQKCDANGNLTFTNIPDGNWGLVVLDQWDDLIVDGSSRAVNVSGGQTLNMTYGSFSWQTHLWTNTYLDVNGNGIQDSGEPGLAQVPARIRMRNGKPNNTLFTDVSGQAHFDETFPLFNWYTTESDTTRFKATGVHVVNDAGGQLDGPAPKGNGNQGPYQAILNSTESFPLPANLRTPGTVYCHSADCTDVNLSTNPTGGGPGGSTGRIDPGSILSEGWQGGLSQFDIIEWGKQPYAVGENGGVRGNVVYASTRPFDDPMILSQNIWEPLVPNVTVNLYQENTAPDGTTSLKLVDTTVTSSWDAWAQGFRADGVTPNMSCPGEDSTDPFFSYTLAGTANYLTPNVTVPYNSQYKCFDGYHNLNQIQPAPYDGMYQFPSPTCASAAGNTITLASGQTIKCATVANPAAGSVGSAAAILPPGKYVAEVVPPFGYEIVKEEDKNILIGDSYIAPVTQQFGAISSIYIVPDQAAIDQYNSCYGTGGGCTNPTTQLGRTQFSGFNAGGMITMNAPCVGRVRIVPDYMSISPESGEVAPFAGASRPLCDRKEITIEDQMQAQTDFFIWTKTPAASHYTGFVTDDFSSEYDTTNPSFGEKFAIPNLPISVRDYNGVEISRVYSDQWGTFNGLVFSTWEVNPPNPTGYAPGVMVMCMNDPGPIPGPNGTMITDPNYNPNYSDFCYEWSFMPADTAYLDTPVVPTAAFADAYNPPDCAYPDATPAIKSVVSADIAGPWVSAAGHTLTITALGDTQVPNHAYSGPAATQPPFNQKFITRHYGFGSSQGTVTIAGVAATVTGWSDTSITVVAPTIPSSSSSCTIQQENAPAGTTPARCGELVIKAASGQQSIDSITVTVGGKKPTVLGAGGTIQSAIDAAAPGDMIIVPAGTYTEMVLMWKPVRLQGVGAASVAVNANTHPAGQLLDPWRRKVNCLFGLALDGGFINNAPNSSNQPTHPYDPSSTYSCNFYNNVKNGQVTSQTVVDPIPLEPVVGWDASLNGNIAELLQEPTLLGAYEGAAITVLAKGLENNNTANCDTLNNAGCIPLNSRTGRGGDCNVASPFYQSNFLCNPSRIDGITFTNSSQGGGGIFLHGWNHYMEVANNRVYNNSGTLGGGIIVGQSETPPSTIDAAGNELPFLLNQHVNVHNNSVTGNTAYGDELNSNTPAASGGVTFCDGSDYYRFDNNWVCGNLSMGDGGGMAHFGFSVNGDIEHNVFVFNQSTNPTLTTYGGGLVVEGVGPDGTVCENSATIDMDCPPELADGVGPGLVINANLFQGNTAESGTGGGLALLHVNGTDVQRNPGNPRNWHSVTITNNIFANNVAGWAGGGVSLQDAVLVNFVNNTVVSNDTTGTAGVLFDTTLAPNANVPPPGCDPTQPNSATNNCTNTAVTQSPFLPAGLETAPHSLLLSSVFTNPHVVCPTGHPNCTKFSNPILSNNLFWQNRSFRITTGPQGTPGGLQTAVQLVPQLSQGSTTGTCPSGANYWDIGVFGDTGPSNHGSTFTMSPQWSILTDSSDYASGHNFGSAPNFTAQYCNGSRVPPEIVTQLCTSTANAPGCIQPGTVGIQVPPGVPDSTYAGPGFSLNPAATVDEGSNWINMLYGPLSLSNATGYKSAGVGLPALGNYAPVAGSPAIDAISTTASTYSSAPHTDFFGNPRPDLARTAIDIGAIEYQGAAGAVLVVSPTALSFGNQTIGTASAAQTLTLSNNGGAGATGIALTFGGPFARSTASAGTCGTTLASGASCTINVVFQPTGAGSATGSVSIAASVPVTGSPVFLSGNGVAAGTVSITPNPLTISLPAGSFTNTGTITLTNTSTNGASVTINSVSVSGGSILTYLWNAVVGEDHCSGQTLLPGQPCTIGVRFTNVLSARNGSNRTGTISFTDNATGSPQTGTLNGQAH